MASEGDDMGYEPDYEGEEAKTLKEGDGGIVGPAGQKVKSAAPTGTEQIAAWGGFKGGEELIDQTEPQSLSPKETGAQGDDAGS